MIEESKKGLLRLLKGKAYSKGFFKLTSGKESKEYVDGKMITLSPEGAYWTAEILLDLIAEDKVDAVGGLMIGADPILGALAAISYLKKKPISTFIVRKKIKPHGKLKWIEGPVPKRGRVVIIDDVTTTGGSILEAIKIVKEHTQCEIVKVITLVDRLEGAKEKLEKEGYHLLSIFTINDLRNAGGEHFEPSQEPTGKRATSF